MYKKSKTYTLPVEDREVFLPEELIPEDKDFVVELMGQETKGQPTEGGLLLGYSDNEEERVTIHYDFQEKDDVVTPVVDAIKSIPETVIPETDLSPVTEALKNVEDAIYATEKDESDLTPVVRALEAVKLAVDEKKLPEPVDMTSELLAIAERIPQEKDLSEITELLQSLVDKETPLFEIPDNLISDNRIKVEVDRIGGGGSGSSLTSSDANYLFSEESSLTDGSAIQSGWLDMQKFDKYQFEAIGSTTSPGFTWKVESSSSPDGTGSTLTSNTTTTNLFFLANLTARQRYMRFTWTNNSGATVSNAYCAVKGFIGSSDKLSVFPVNVQPSDFSQAALVQSIQRGRDPSGIYQAVAVNEAGAILQSDFGTEVARGSYPGYSINTKFGRNGEIDTTTDPEDIWIAGGDYTGFDATTAEDIQVLSSSANDAGTLVTSGTATADGASILTDSSATFVSDGVAVNDVIINDTIGNHSFVKSIDSETQITVYCSSTFSNGDAYRIATPASTGACVISLPGLLDANYDRASVTKYVILNGTTPVTVGGTWFRCERLAVIGAGSNETNVGTITARQAVTTANVFATIGVGYGQTLQTCFTIPNSKVGIIKRIRVAITRASGAAGSATVALLVRERGGAWATKRIFELSTSNSADLRQEGGLIIRAESDIKLRVLEVSDNDTIAEGTIEYYFVDE